MNRRWRGTGLVAVALAALGTAACSDAPACPRGERFMHLPAVPGWEAEALAWDLAWWTGGSVERLETAPLPADSTQAICLAVEEAWLAVVVGRPIAVTSPATAASPNGAPGYLAPAGWWGPGRAAPGGVATGAPSSEATLNFADGPLAAVLLDLARGGVDPALINVERLAAAVVELNLADPTDLDTERLRAALAGGATRIFDVRRRDRSPVTVHAPGVPWRGDSPGAPPNGGVDPVATISLAPGERRTVYGPAGWRTVYRSRDGATMVADAPGPAAEPTGVGVNGSGADSTRREEVRSRRR